MIALDTSVLVDALKGVSSPHTHLVKVAVAEYEAVIPAVVITELLSDPRPNPLLDSVLGELQTLDILPGYWERAGLLRAKLKAHKLKAKTADALIAQSCIDHDVPLLTRDVDFKHYAKYGRLKLVKV